ncbi:SRPBCC family protein [Luminiphilus sp. nBUS_07]|uniref:SRPBCC family protein n=1 Tax=Luminiphilus sp. nBUS_07 TaxID=3395314 RepID=UPI003EBC1090
MVKFGEDCRGDRDLVAFPCHEEGGLIFAVLDPTSECDIRGFLGEMMSDVGEKHFEDWHYVGQRVIHGANWKVALDGYLEGYHFQAAHPETIAPRTYTNIMAFEAYGPHMLVGYPAKTIEKLKDIPVDELWQHENDGYDFIRLFFPNVSIFVAPEITQIAQLIPGPGPLENTTVLHFIHHTKPKDAEENAALEQMADWLMQVVDEEDYQVGLQVQRGLQSGHLADVIFGKNESGNQFAHRCIQYYADGGEGELPSL